MRSHFWLIPSLVLVAAPTAFAQAPQEQPPEAEPGAEPPSQEEQDVDVARQQPSQQDADVTEEELETFAEIYVELEDTLSKFESEIATVETEEEAQDVQVRLQQESYEKIEEQGWSPEKYNTVIQAVNADPDLLQRALALIEERY